ncbi:hypothetical protein ACIQLJ_08480 [Microbacterium sp. NPDC091313]
MEWIATAIAVVAAAAAIWQAFEARRARRDAQAAAKDARDTEERTVSAAERTARALEDQAAMERAERERYRNPWTATRIPSDWGLSVEFRLGGDEPISGIAVKGDPIDAHLSTRGDLPDVMRPGQAIYIDWFKTMGSPRTIELVLEWKRENGDDKSMNYTIP